MANNASLPALTRLMSSQATFEPVSAKTQPVSGHTTCQIPDIENSCSRDSSRKTPPSVGSARFSSPKTRPLPANPRECRHFSDSRKFLRRDPGGWLGRQDSNLGMAESKSTCSAFNFKGHSEKAKEFCPFSINRLARLSEAMELGKLVSVAFLAHQWRRLGLLSRAVLIMLVTGLAAINAAGVYSQFVAAHFATGSARRGRSRPKPLHLSPGSMRKPMRSPMSTPGFPRSTALLPR